jgi:hypothetical protein
LRSLVIGVASAMIALDAGVGIRGSTRRGRVVQWYQIADSNAARPG